MIGRFRLGHWKLVVSLRRVEDTVGLNSRLADGNHILMWDFDDDYYELIVARLRRLQREWELPRVAIVQSSGKKHYLALCLCRRSWWEVKAIIAHTFGIDEEWFRGGIIREYFTIRAGPKHGTVPIPVEILPSKVPDEVTIEDLVSWDRYETTGIGPKHILTWET